MNINDLREIIDNVGDNVEGDNVEIELNVHCMNIEGPEYSIFVNKWAYIEARDYKRDKLMVYDKGKWR